MCKQTTEPITEEETAEAPCYCYEIEGDNDNCPTHGKAAQ